MPPVLRSETLSSVLRNGSAIGAWCGFASTSSVELMTLLPFDFLVLDMQHCEVTLAGASSLLAAFPRDRRPFAVVRPPENDYHAINWLLDQGADGVLVPMVNSREDAVRAVRASKYPPVGRRSFGPFRAARYGTALDEYIRNADERSALIVQIEDAQAARDIDSILEVEGIDAAFMGPNDLAYSMLKPGQRIQGNAAQWAAFARTPEVLDLCAHVMERARVAGIPFGMTASSMDDAKAWLSRGASFATFGSDFLFLRRGAELLCGFSGEKK
jgi:2-keto-3-deoxy-L-rhamnonate aldolase RhmA